MSFFLPDGVLDLREDAPLLSRSSEANNFLFQSIRTDIKHPIRLDVKEEEVTVVGSDAVTFLPLYICSHLQVLHVTSCDITRDFVWHYMWLLAASKTRSNAYFVV